MTAQSISVFPATRRQMIRRSLSFSVLTLLLACAGCQPQGQDSWQHYVGGGHYPARTPAMSPDGRVIVFSSPRTGNGDICQINADGSAPIRLTNVPAFETDPIFSPDGSSIAYAREAGGARHIWLMDRDGTNQRQLTSGRVLDDVWSFSPDGTELQILRSPFSTGLGRAGGFATVNLRTKDVRKLDAMLEYSSDGKRVAWYAINEGMKRNEVWIMNADGSERHFLAVGLSPRFSADAQTVLYSGESSVADPGSDWNTISVDGTNGRKLGRMLDPVFASDGKHIVYQTPGFKRELWKMDIDGTNRVRLPAPAGYIDFLRPCRAGFILKHVASDRVGDIYVLDTAAWTVKQVTSMQ